MPQQFSTPPQNRPPAGGSGGSLLPPPFVARMSPIQVVLIGTTVLLTLVTVDVARRVRRLERGA